MGLGAQCGALPGSSRWIGASRHSSSPTVPDSQDHLAKSPRERRHSLSLSSAPGYCCAAGAVCATLTTVLDGRSGRGRPRGGADAAGRARRARGQPGRDLRALYGAWHFWPLDAGAVRPGQAAERVRRTGHVVGLDYHAGMLVQARSLGLGRGAPIEWREGDAQRLPLPDSTFDLVLCQHGLQFFPDRPAALREMRCVLAPGGRLAVAVWLALDRNPAHAAVVAAPAWHAGAELAALMQVPFSLGRADELRRLLAEAGFQRIEIVRRRRSSRFPSARAFARIVLAASVLGRSGVQLDERQVDAILAYVDAVLEPYASPDGLIFPMEGHLALGWA